MTNRVRCQHSTETRALPAETGGCLGGQSPVRRICARWGQHLPPDHRAVAVFSDPKLENLVLDTERSLEELTETNLARQATVPVLRVRFANPHDAVQVGITSLTDQ